jgi:hypothetical protein
MIEVEMQRAGSTVGRASGSFRSWSEGDVLTVQKGEFSHLSDDMVSYQDRQMKPESSPRYEVREGKAGWHKVYDTREGEYVDGESSRDRSEAEANAARLNDG